MGDHLTDVIKIRSLARLVRVNCSAKWVARAHGYIIGYTHEILDTPMKYTTHVPVSDTDPECEAN
jgi:hypothetical protein